MINTLLGFYYIKTLFKFILHYQYQCQYQILILIPYQYNSWFLYSISHIYILLKISGGDTFQIHKEQNLKLLLINIYAVFFLLVFF